MRSPWAVRIPQRAAPGLRWPFWAKSLPDSGFLRLWGVFQEFSRGFPDGLIHAAQALDKYVLKTFRIGPWIRTNVVQEAGTSRCVSQGCWLSESTGQAMMGEVRHGV